MNEPPPRSLSLLQNFIQNLIFYGWLLLFSAVAIPVLSLAVALTRPFSTRRATMRRFRRAIWWWGVGVIRGTVPFVSVRYENLSTDERAGPYIIICNHRSAADPFLLAFLPFELVQVVNVWPFRIPVLGAFARWAGYLNVRRMPREQFFETACSDLEAGVSLVFFPEGTRARGREMGTFHGIAFRLALRARASIVPYCITGTEQVMPRGTTFLRPGTISIRRLSSVEWNEYKDMSPFQLKNYVRNLIAMELDKMESK